METKENMFVMFSSWCEILLTYYYDTFCFAIVCFLLLYESDDSAQMIN